MSITHNICFIIQCWDFWKKTDTVERSNNLFCSNLYNNYNFYIVSYIIKSSFFIIEELWDSKK